MPTTRGGPPAAVGGPGQAPTPGWGGLSEAGGRRVPSGRGGRRGDEDGWPGGWPEDTLVPGRLPGAGGRLSSLRCALGASRTLRVPLPPALTVTVPTASLAA